MSFAIKYILPNYYLKCYTEILFFQWKTMPFYTISHFLPKYSIQMHFVCVKWGKESVFAMLALQLQQI